MPKRRLDEGSAPLETSVLLALLLLPLTPMLQLFSLALDQIAAESIARHALRYAILHSNQQSIREVTETSVAMLASRWETSASFHLNCGNCSQGSMVSLTIFVGSASATQVAGLEPR